MTVFAGKTVAQILNSTISGNIAAFGGFGAGVYVYASTTIANCTISGNQNPFDQYSITEGGAIYNLSTLNLNNDANR